MAANIRLFHGISKFLPIFLLAQEILGGNRTHGTGALRQFFNVVKGSSDSAIKRAFITGVSPVTMDDLTSGFNIGTNYTMHRKFNAMVGFTEKEVRELLDYYRQHFTFKHTTDELIEIMKPWYDNYCFAKECLNEPPLYNSDMVLYFLYNYLDGEGSIPDNMLDANIRTPIFAHEYQYIYSLWNVFLSENCMIDSSLSDLY